MNSASTKHRELMRDFTQTLQENIGGQLLGYSLSVSAYLISNQSQVHCNPKIENSKLSGIAIS